ncbi:MAG: universal stress protein [Burkholderiaceae bacterium]
MPSVIAQAVREQAIDMLIMGAYGHSPLRGLFLGSKTSDRCDRPVSPRCCCADAQPVLQARGWRMPLIRQAWPT